MKIKKVIVDKMPDGCRECMLSESNGEFSINYHCTALPEDGAGNDLGNVFDYMFRRHDCPLIEEG